MTSLEQGAGSHMILVVDDDTIIRTYIKSILQHAGGQVIEAGDGVEALELFRAWQHRIDLVITDIRMPRMTGTELARLIRSACPAIPLIFVSGEARSLGLNDPENGFSFAEKPFAPRTLLDATRQFLN